MPCAFGSAFRVKCPPTSPGCMGRIQVIARQDTAVKLRITRARSRRWGRPYQRRMSNFRWDWRLDLSVHRSRRRQHASRPAVALSNAGIGWSADLSPKECRSTMVRQQRTLLEYWHEVCSRTAGDICQLGFSVQDSLQWNDRPRVLGSAKVQRISIVR